MPAVSACVDIERLRANYERLRILSEKVVKRHLVGKSEQNTFWKSLVKRACARADSAIDLMQREYNEQRLASVNPTGLQSLNALTLSQDVMQSLYELSFVIVGVVTNNTGKEAYQELTAIFVE